MKLIYGTHPFRASTIEYGSTESGRIAKISSTNLNGCVPQINFTVERKENKLPIIDVL